MPTRLVAPVLTVDVGKMNQIDTTNVEALFSMWTVFNRCAESMEEGRRLENLSWRLWNRETFCCEPRARFPDTPTTPTAQPLAPRSKKSLPDLSSSADSASSDEDLEECYPTNRSYSPPVVIRGLNSSKVSAESLSSSRNPIKPITSQALQSMFMSIKEAKPVEKHDMPALPISVTTSVCEVAPSARNPKIREPTVSLKHTPTPSQETSEQTTPRRQSDQRASQSSTSTAPLSSPESHMERSQTYDSQTSAELIAPSASIVRGFGPSHVSSSHRHPAPTSAPPQDSQASPRREQPPAAPPKPMPVPIKSALRPNAAKSGFVVGCGSSGDESSVDDRSFQTRQSSLTAQLHARPPAGEKKKLSFKEDLHEMVTGSKPHNEEAIDSDGESDSDDEPDDDVSESAIEEDEDESDDWEDSNTDSGAASPSERALFQRVDSKPNLVSRRSLLTTQLHQTDRANALASEAQRLQPTLRRSRPSAPSHLSVASTPEDDDDDDDDDDGDDEEEGSEPALEMPAGHPLRAAPPSSRARPILMTAANSHQPALSPRTTRRNMLASELTESLRKHLLHERQQKTTMASAALKRRHTAHDVTNLKTFPGEPERERNAHGYPTASASGATSQTSSWNAYVDHGEYNARGW